MRLILTRRSFGQGAALTVALAVAGRQALAHADSHAHEIRIHGFAFAPAELIIAPGDVVVWSNADLAPHTATALSGHWDTGEIAGDAAASVTFEEPGEHRYACAFHPRMTGRVRVAPPA
jgi:plastocyanin